ncbi:MAG: hypothetical protein U0414_23970 [Polyangiaceae bacterium]
MNSRHLLGALALALELAACASGTPSSEGSAGAVEVPQDSPVTTAAAQAKRTSIVTKLCRADSLSECERLCSEGSTLSCTRWAHMLRAGYSTISEHYPGNQATIPKAPSTARRLYAQACADGYAHACNLAGEMFERGEGGEEDSARARVLYERACIAGSATGCYRHAASLDETEGQEDALGKRAILARACELGEPYACSAFHDLDDAITRSGRKPYPPPPPRAAPGLKCPAGTTAFREVTTSGAWIEIARVQVFCARGEPDAKQGPMIEWASLEDEAATNGVISARGAYLDGKPTGVWETFDMSGEPISRGSYVEGAKEGLWMERDESGEHRTRYDHGKKSNDPP